MFNQKALKEQIAGLERQVQELRAFQQAVQDGMAVIEFTPDGKVLTANDIFLQVMGYTLDEIKGEKHRMFCEPSLINTPAYEEFWANLRAGKSESGTFQRRDKNGRSIWLEATYSPIKIAGEVTKVVKVAMETTEDVLAARSQQALLDALDHSLATIEFKPDGTITKANKNFTDTMEYSLSEIVGQHHKMFCEPEFYEKNPHFWEDLASGQTKSGQFQRLTKSGRKIWLEATYNPVRADNGEVLSVVKFASDITNQIAAKEELQSAAGYANDQSLEAAKSIEEGTNAIQAVVNINKSIAEELLASFASVENLNTESDKIRAIVTTISEVADQTNLLALNAAIEAARAGEQGRGFAVVADEVRMLAARTSSSTTEISNVVKKNIELMQSALQSMEKVQGMTREGEKLTGDTFALMEELRRGTSEVSKVLADSHARINQG
jgi:methyl-accepting chemotaxis protein